MHSIISSAIFLFTLSTFPINQNTTSFNNTHSYNVLNTSTSLSIFNSSIQLNKTNSDAKKNDTKTINIYSNTFNVSNSRLNSSVIINSSADDVTKVKSHSSANSTSLNNGTYHPVVSNITKTINIYSNAFNVSNSRLNSSANINSSADDVTKEKSYSSANSTSLNNGTNHPVVSNIVKSTEIHHKKNNLESNSSSAPYNLNNSSSNSLNNNSINETTSKKKLRPSGITNLTNPCMSKNGCSGVESKPNSNISNITDSIANRSTETDSQNENDYFDSNSNPNDSENANAQYTTIPISFFDIISQPSTFSTTRVDNNDDSLLTPISIPIRFSDANFSLKESSSTNASTESDNQAQFTPVSVPVSFIDVTNPDKEK